MRTNGWWRHAARLNSITVQMSCLQYLRLRQHYDAALRRWAQLELSAHDPDVLDASARLAEVVRQKGLRERNEASERMRLHEQNCPVCNLLRKPRRPIGLA
jgi:predicted ArsR family transcriptional regulator